MILVSETNPAEQAELGLDLGESQGSECGVSALAVGKKFAAQCLWLFEVEKWNSVLQRMTSVLLELQGYSLNSGKEICWLIAGLEVQKSSAIHPLWSGSGTLEAATGPRKRKWFDCEQWNLDCEKQILVFPGIYFEHHQWDSESEKVEPVNVGIAA